MNYVKNLKSTCLPEKVKIVEVGPRDGLQNEKQWISTAHKIELIERLGAAGLQHIEAAAFVSPKWVPQMADGADVLMGITRQSGISYSALTPNMKGLDAAIAANVDEVVIFGAASEAFSQRNINCSVAESIARFVPVARAAKLSGLRLRGSLSCALGCPYQGDVPVSAVVDLAKRLIDLGCDELDIADTIGIGTARHVQTVCEAVANIFPIQHLSGHFHDTYGQALTNIYAALETGISTFHSSVAGLGGCPYAQGASGNVATEDVVYLFEGLGIKTGINLRALAETGAFISNILGRSTASRVGRALLAQGSCA